MKNHITSWPPMGAGFSSDHDWRNEWSDGWMRWVESVVPLPVLRQGREILDGGELADLEGRPGEAVARFRSMSEGQVTVRVRLSTVAYSLQQQYVDHMLSRTDVSNVGYLTLANSEKFGLEVLPYHWNGIRCTCSSRHWHGLVSPYVAATLLALQQEIAYSAEVLFMLRGIDLGHILRLRGHNYRTNYDEDLANPIASLHPLCAQPPATPAVPPSSGLDLGTLDDQFELFSAMMREQLSPDIPGPWRDTYTRTLNSIRTSLRRFLAGKRSFRALFPSLPSRLSLDFSPGDQPGSDILGDQWAANIVGLLRLRPEALPLHTPQVRAHYWALQLAMRCLLTRNICPRAFCSPTLVYSFHWNPALIHRAMPALLRQLDAMIPSGMVVAGRQFLRQPALELTCQYINTLVYALAPASRGDVLLDMLFHNKPCNALFSGRRHLSRAIALWLRPYRIPYYRNRCVYVVTDNEDGTFTIQPSIFDPDDPGAPPLPITDSLYRRRGEAVRDASVLSFITCRAVEGMRADLEQWFYNDIPFRVDSSQIARFLDHSVPVFDAYGIPVFMPKGLRQRVAPRLTLRLRLRQEMEERTPSININDLLDYDWTLALGDEVVSPEEFRAMLESNQTLLRFKSHYVYLAPEEMQRYRDALSGRLKPASMELIHSALAEEYDCQPVALTAEARQALRRMTALEPVAPPATLQATLRPYQERGYSWLYRNLRLGFGSILADDMGLGKTLQTIALILKLKEEGLLEEGKALIVVPTSLLTNWQAEIARFAPSLTTAIYHGPSRSQSALAADVALTTYGVARSDLETLNLYPWRLLVIDEAQNIKNHDSQQARAIRAIQARARIALSGTPVENRLAEFWSIMHFCNPGYLGPLSLFNQRYANPIQAHDDQRQAERLRRITSPFLMRRMKTDKNIIADLPDKIEKTELVSLLPAQAALYQSVVDEAMRTLNDLTPDDDHALFRRRGIILQMILALKQVCNHPSLYLKNGDLRPELSGKTQRLLELVESILENGEKVLIFSQFRQMGEMLAQFLGERFGEPVLFYHGGCNVEQRASMVERFQTDPAQRLFVLSLKAAGTGLNLTAATHVIHYDLWWNPAVETQATDRAYRIGQHRNVVVHRFIVHDTFEERIDRMIQEKRRLADITVSTGEGWIANLSNDELQELFGPQAPR